MTDKAINPEDIELLHFDKDDSGEEQWKLIIECKSKEDYEFKKQQILSDRAIVERQKSNRIITLCGSTRFFKLFDEVNYKLTINGFIVLSIGCHSQSDYCLGLEEIENAKVDLDVLHKKKIDLSEAILVLDKDGYIGNSTRSEIEHAVKNNKIIYYYSQDGLQSILDTGVMK